MAGRRINDNVGQYIAQETVKHLISAGQHVKGARAVVLGMTSKENCPDIRNSKVIDVIRELRSFGIDVAVHDPIASGPECEHEYGVCLVPWDELPKASALVVAVAHDEYREMGTAGLLERLAPSGVFVDVKGTHDRDAIEAAGRYVWRL